MDKYITSIDKSSKLKTGKYRHLTNLEKVINTGIYD